MTQPITEIRGLSFEVKGGAKNGFIRHYHETHDDGEGNVETVKLEEKMKRKKKVLTQKMMNTEVFPVGGEIQGDYRIRYKFTLPDNIPSSLMYKNKHSECAPKAKVKYFVKAKVESENDDMCMSHKAVLAVREKPESLQINTSIEETSEIKTWGCCAQGTSSLKAKFNQNVFSPMDVAEGEIEIDNSECNVAVSEVSFAITQVMKQEIHHIPLSEENIILERTISGPAAQEGGWKEELKLELEKIKYEVADTKKKKGKVKKISKEDKFAMASL